MNYKLLKTIKMLFILSQFFLVGAYAAQPEIGKQYTLENAFLKSAKVLSLDSQNKLYMESPNPSNDRQKWIFSQGPSGAFYMHNVALGQNKAVDSDQNRPDIRNKGNYTGQHWRFTKEGDYFRISNNYQGANRVLDTANAPGNYLFFEAKARDTTGTKWKMKPAPISLKVTTTTSNIDLESVSEAIKCPEGQVFVKGSDGPLFKTAGRCQAVQNDKDFLHVSGMILHARDHINTNPCKAMQSKSLLLKRMETNQLLKIASNDCISRSGKSDSPSYFTTQAEFEKVSQFFVLLENTFIKNLKESPEVVLNYDSEDLVTRLKLTRGKVSYSELEAFVLGELINSLKKPRKQRSPLEQAAVNWLVRGALSAERTVWNTAQEEYQRWKSDPCNYKPPYKKGSPKEWNQWAGMHANCGGEANSLASTFSGAIFQVQQGNPSIFQFIQWGAYEVGATFFSGEKDELLNRAIAMRNVYIVGAGTVAVAGAAAVVAAGAGTMAAAVFPFSTAIAASGGLYTMTVAGAAAPSALGAGALAGPAAVVVGGIVGTVAAITMNIEDTKFHDRMNTNDLIFNVLGQPIKASEIDFDTTVDLYSARIQGATNLSKFSDFEKFAASMNGYKDVQETDPSAAIEFAFSDAMYSKNSSRFLPVTVPLTKGISSEKQQSTAVTSTAKVTAALTRANGKATYLFYSDGSHARTSANKSIGFDAGYPQKMPGGLSGIPNDWYSTINAAVPYQSTAKGYMWSNGKYLRLNDVKVDAGYPTNMPGGWQNMPAGWAGNVDAAIHYQPNNRHYFFKGNEYIRLTGTKVDGGYPARLPGGWVGMPSHFAQGIDAATFRNGHVYMIKGDEYIRFSGTKVDSGYPKPMSNWPQ